MVTILNSVGKRFLVFSKVNETSAKPEPFRVLEPLKIKSSRLSERRVLILCSPMTHRMASTIFDFPHPFGPTIPVIWLSRLMTVLSAKLLNPFISNDFSRTLLKFWSVNIQRQGWNLPLKAGKFEACAYLHI